MRHPELIRPAFLAALAAAAACGGGGGGGGGGGVPTASLKLLAGDAPADELSSFEVTITGLFLTDDAGVESGNLLPNARTIDLIELAAKSSLLEATALAAGVFDSARLALDAASITARDLSGTLVPINPTGGGAIARFAAPVALAAGANARIHFEIPLDLALADDPGVPGGLLFTPWLVVRELSGSDEPLDEIHGSVLSEDPPGHSLDVSLLELEDGTTHGRLRIELAPGAVLLDDDGEPFADEAAFFSFLLPGDRVEAGGALADDGSFVADLVHAERDDGGAGAVARIEGTLLDVDVAADRLTLRIRTVEFGRSVVEPVLAALGDPPSIEVEYSGAKIRVEGEDPRSGSELDLAIGQEVEVDFESFVAPPFPAREIEIEDEAVEYEGTITDASGVPGTFVVHLEPHDPAVLAGLVDSSATDVDVLLDGSERIWLKLDQEPGIAAPDLLADLRVRLRGTLSGPSGAPAIDASDVRVRAGRLRGAVTAADEVSGTFTVDVDSVDDPFGGAALPDPVVLRFGAGAIVEGDAADEASFFALFAGLGAGETLEVELFGLADGLGGATAWHVEAEVD